MNILVGWGEGERTFCGLGEGEGDRDPLTREYLFLDSSFSLLEEEPLEEEEEERDLERDFERGDFERLTSLLSNTAVVVLSLVLVRGRGDISLVPAVFTVSWGGGASNGTSCIGFSSLLSLSTEGFGCGLSVGGARGLSGASFFATTGLVCLTIASSLLLTVVGTGEGSLFVLSLRSLLGDSDLLPRPLDELLLLLEDPELLLEERDEEEEEDEREEPLLVALLRLGLRL